MLGNLAQFRRTLRISKPGFQAIELGIVAPTGAHVGYYGGVAYDVNRFELRAKR